MIAIGDICELKVSIAGNKLFRHRNPENSDRLDKLANRMMEDRKAIVQRLFETRHAPARATPQAARTGSEAGE